MDKGAKKPSNEFIREYLERRKKLQPPALPLREIRRQLGWELAEMARHHKPKKK